MGQGPRGSRLGRSWAASLCPASARPRAGAEGPLPGGSARLALSEEQRGSAATFVRSLFNLHGSRCDPDSPINPALVILFYFPPTPLPSLFFGRVQTLLWSLFCSCSSFLSLPVARCPSLPREQLLFLLLSFAAVGSTTPTTSVTKLVLTGQPPVPESTSCSLAAGLGRDLAAGGSGMLPEHPPCLAAPLPKSTRQGLALGTRCPTRPGC